jgi:hypothetical protein
MDVSGASNYLPGPLLSAKDKEKLVAAGLPLNETPEKIQNIIKKLLKEANRVNAQYYTVAIKNESLKNTNAAFRQKANVNAKATPVTPKETNIQYPLSQDEDGEIAFRTTENAIRDFADKLFFAKQVVAELEEENKVLEKDSIILKEEFLKKQLLTQDMTNYQQGPLITAEDKEKLVRAGLPIQKTPENVQKIIKKLLNATNRVNADYDLVLSLNEDLRKRNTTLRMQVGFHKRLIKQKLQKVEDPLSNNELQEIKSQKGEPAILSFIDKLMYSKRKVAELREENRALDRENQELQEELAKKLLLSPIDKEKEERMSPPSSAESTSPSVVSMQISPSPQKEEKKLTLHPSPEQRLAEIGQKQAAPHPEEFPQKVPWIDNFKIALQNHKQEMEHIFSSLKSPLSGSALYAKFLNTLSRHPENVLPKIDLSDWELDALDFALNFLAKGERQITGEDVDKILKNEVI